MRLLDLLPGAGQLSATGSIGSQGLGEFQLGQQLVGDAVQDRA
jgi:hypothetical protein